MNIMFYKRLARNGVQGAQRIVDASLENGGRMGMDHLVCALAASGESGKKVAARVLTGDGNPDQPRDAHGMWQSAANAAIRATVKAEESTQSESGASFTSAQSNKLHKQAAKLHQKAAELAPTEQEKAIAQRFVAQHKAAIGPEGSISAGLKNTESFEKLQESSRHESAGIRARYEGNHEVAKHSFREAARLHREIGNTLRAAELEKMIGGDK